MAESGPGLVPTESVTALAAERGLGAWVKATYLPRKGMFLRRWEGSRLYFFGRGLVVTGPDGFQAAYDWETVSVLESRSSINGAVADARYTLFDRSGAAVGVGRGVDMIFPRRRETLGITSLVKGAPFTFEGDWGPHIQRRVLLARMPGVLASLERGESVPFGAVRLSAAGVSVKERSATWDDLKEVKPFSGMIGFHDSRRRTVLPGVHTAHVANLYLFLGICRHMGCA
ncbi:DUF6585 family protein [Streptomyces sp. NPDC060209]|uniref:DUF6585 family protein n=1 Tax=Streptomyces sp. NPDC060209 TaxID=3347073 RepID=UPI003669F848